MMARMARKWHEKKVGEKPHKVEGTELKN